MVRKRNFFSITVFALICLVVLLTFPSFLYAAWPDITLNPTTASIGDALTITTDTGFEAVQGTGKVTFTGSGDTIAVTNWTDTTIVLNVPAATTTGNVTVTNNTGTTTSAATLTIKPAITSINPASDYIGHQITITGTNFGAVIGTGKVTFTGSGDTIAVTNWSDTTIVLNIPAGTTTGNVTVTENTGVAASDPVTFTIISFSNLSRNAIVTGIVTQEPVPVRELHPWEITDTGYYEKTDTGFTTMFYSRFFRRPPEQSALNEWLVRLRSGSVTGEDLINVFVFGEENQVIISDYTNSEFIIFLYEKLFNREPEDDNYNIWLMRMNNGMTREMVVKSFTRSAEFENLCSQFGILPYAGYVE